MERAMHSQDIAGHLTTDGRLPEIAATGTVKYGSRELPVTDQVLVLSAEHQSQIASAALDGLKRFFDFAEKPEPTLAQAEIGLPTSIARVDCSISKNGEVLIYEVDERPAGMGVTHRIVHRADGKGIRHSFDEHFEKHFAEEPIAAVSPVSRDYGTDDFPILPVVPISEALLLPNPVLVRAEPTEITGVLEALVERSIATAKTEGSKAYMVRTGQAQWVSSPSELPSSDESFTIKKRQTSRSRAVWLHLKSADRKIYGKKGTTTHSRILQEAGILTAADGQAIAEPFKPPIRAVWRGDKIANMILRVFVLVDSPESAHVIGSSYFVREEVLVHGASNAIAGPIILENGRVG